MITAGQATSGASTPTLTRQTVLDSLEDVAAAMRIAWPVGFGLLIALAVSTVVALSESQQLWAVFFALGIALPCAVGTVLASGSRWTGTRIASATRWVALAMAGVAIGAGVVRGATNAYLVVVALVEAGAVVFLTARANTADSRPARRTAGAVLWVVLSVSAWGLGGSVMWWQQIHDLHHSWILGTFTLSVVLVFAALWGLDVVPGRILGAIGTVLALAVLAAASVRTNDLFDNTIMYHWEFYVGPAELVRQGGWLLWDVPSQYGFLSELVIAWLPAPSAWESLFVLNSLMSFLLAATVFFMLRSLGGGVLNLVMSLVVAVVACFVRPGLSAQIIGPDGYPSTGAFRFLWGVALVLVLVLYARIENPRVRSGLLVLGSCVWVIGVLWSAESAIYSTFAWLPAYFVIVSARNWNRSDPRRSAVAIARWLALPAGLLGASIAAVLALYLIGLGHLPDPRAFYEFGLTYQGGFGAYPFDPQGPGWVLLVVYAGALATIAYRVRSRPAAMTAALVGVAALVYATGSYFVGRSHPNNIWNLAPEIVIAIAALVFFATRDRSPSPLPVMLKLVAAPILTMFLFGSVVDKGEFIQWTTKPQHDIAHIDTALLPTDPSLEDLLQAHVRPGDSVAYLVDDADPTLSPHLYPDVVQPDGAPQWLPLVPFRAINILPPDRGGTYLERFIARHGGGGWLIERSGSGQGEWVKAVLRRHFSAGPSYTAGGYELTYWSPVG